MLLVLSHGALNETHEKSCSVLRRSARKTGDCPLFYLTRLSACCPRCCCASGHHPGTQGNVDDIDIVRSVFFGLVITPWAVYFLSVVVDQLEESRQRLAKLVSKLGDMRERDQELQQQAPA